MYHNVHVALYGLDLAEFSSPGLMELVFLSAIPHSLDRICGKEDFAKNVNACLDLAEAISDEDRAIVFDAVMKHSELNKEDDSLVLRMLKDSDRLANLTLTLIPRAAQHRPHIPACEMKYLRQSNPKCLASDITSHSRPESVFDDLRYCTHNWPGMMRTDRGKELVGPLVQEIQDYMARAAQQYEAIGMNQIEL